MMIMEVNAAPPMVPATPNFEVTAAAVAEAIPPAIIALPLTTSDSFLLSLMADKTYQQGGVLSKAETGFLVTIS